MNFEFSNFHEIAKMLIQEFNGLKCADDYYAVYAFEPRKLVCSCQQTTMLCSLILFWAAGICSVATRRQLCLVLGYTVRPLWEFALAELAAWLACKIWTDFIADKSSKVSLGKYMIFNWLTNEHIWCSWLLYIPMAFDALKCKCAHFEGAFTRTLS